MKVVLQRCKEANVTVDHKIIGQIGVGLTLLVGITHEDTLDDLQTLAEKIVHLRIFEDEEGKMNRSLLDVGGSILSISQFTLYGDCHKGRRPNFLKAAKPEQAEQLYNDFNEELKSKGVHVETGKFGAMMDVQLINQGPVTMVLETPWN